jgi:hypothetical protein
MRQRRQRKLGHCWTSEGQRGQIASVLFKELCLAVVGPGVVDFLGLEHLSEGTRPSLEV